jgi:uncharacterized damage-inducible protein DinB
MDEVRRIDDQLRRSFKGPAWHGPSIQELVKDVTPEKAAGRPLPHAHTIWEIVLHIGVWEDAVRRRLEGEKYEPTPEQDWPAVRDCSEAAWELALADLETTHAKLRGAVASLDAARLNEKVPGEAYSIYFMLHGVIQHNLYHAGQIAILRKA